MATFVLMTRLPAEDLRDARARVESGQEWMKKVEKSCPEVEWIAHYSLLGPYDFMTIYRAPDVETAHKVSLISRAEGALMAESWEALPYERYLDLLGEVSG